MGHSCRVIEVSGLRVAPVKGLASVPRAGLRLETGGVPEDRRLFLLRDNGSVVTMRRFPTLTAVVPELDLVAVTLTVTFPDGSDALSSLGSAGERVGAVLFGKARTGLVVEGAVAEVLSRYVGERLRLVLAETVGVGWDEGPVSLLGHASVSAVGTPADPAGPDIARFRMLVEVTGTQPFEEDTWVGRRVRLGTASVRISHPLQRCVVVDYRPSSGARDWEGIRTLSARRGADHLTLGVIGEVQKAGDIHVGDPVELS